jgi:hypothetical protein
VLLALCSQVDGKWLQFDKHRRLRWFGFMLGLFLTIMGRFFGMHEVPGRSTAAGQQHYRRNNDNQQLALAFFGVPSAASAAGFSLPLAIAPSLSVLAALKQLPHFSLWSNL